jgi:hypothetical protein
MSAPVIADEVRQHLRERLPSLPAEGDERTRVRRYRALLEELGVRCDETLDLQDLDAVLLASGRGTEALIAARLDDEERHLAYARVIARLLLADLHPPIDARMEYTDDRAKIPRRERSEAAVVRDLARSLVDGRLDTAPRTLFQEVPKLTFAFTPRTAARSTLGGFHLWSDFWYKRSNMYRRWRSRRDVSGAIGWICVVLERGRLWNPA